ncbi:DHA1 family purine ribonucleoside efflux pump-like MFS transporter [Nocardioides albertanoniae]|uniref:DHA1 family purine ribonucleoside efflux pump-like MFS transporter n=1 Tax=Nocardioides albertanoniae TaxID=1175486 RepID=A0A543ABC5_9ACTN|nr:DHA1 family purine ribonucleoside efflux pump-like MFS transporter [Nocardioides albertanoniae]
MVALAAGIAILVTSEFLPAGVLPTMARDLGVSEGTAGLAVAATAIAGALTAPSIAMLLPRTDRRTVLVGLLVAAAVANLAVALAPGFLVLLAGRLLLGAALAGFWSFAFAAGTYASPGHDHVISTSIALGVTVATIVGVPLGSLLADGPGWRWGFVGGAVLSLLAGVAVARALPSVPAHPGAGLAMMRRAVRNPRLVAGVALVVVVVLGNFVAYPFIRIAIATTSPGDGMWMLVLWGVGGLFGNLAAGRFAAHLRVTVTAAALLLAAGLMLTLLAESTAVMALAMLVWGFGMNMVPVATQLWVTRAEPERTESALALQVTAFQIAITAGAALGGAFLDSYGVGRVLLVGAVSAAVGAAGFAAIRVPRD